MKIQHTFVKSTLAFVCALALTALVLIFCFGFDVQVAEAVPAHTYSYAASGAVITQTCSNEGCALHGGTATISAPTHSLVYDGKTEFEASVSYSDNWAGNNLEIVYKRNGSISTDLKGAGTIEASITIEGATAFVSFEIAPLDISNAVVTLDKDELVYNRAEQFVFPLIDSINVGDIQLALNYDYVYDGNTAVAATNAGNYQLIFNGINNFTGQAIKTWTITPKVVDSPTIEIVAPQGGFVYTSQAIEPSSVVVKDGDVTIDSEEYTVDYLNNVNAGEATLTIRDAEGGNYTVNGCATFVIRPKDIDGAVVTLGDALTYNGTAQVQGVESVVIDGLSVTYTVGGNVQTDVGASDYTLTVAGTGNFAGTAQKEWNMLKAELDMSAVTFEDRTFVYDGTAKNLAVANLPSGVSVEYVGNGKIEAGVYTVSAEFEHSMINYNQAVPMSAILTINQNKVVGYLGDSTNAPSVEVLQNGGLAPNVQVVIEKLEPSSISQDTVKQNEKIVCVYDVALQVDGVEHQPDGRVSVKIAIPAELDGKEFVIIQNGEGKFAQIEYAVEGDYAIVNVSRLDKFAFVVDDTEDLAWLIGLLGALVLLEALIALAIFFASKKKGVKLSGPFASIVLGCLSVFLFGGGYVADGTIAVICVLSILIVAGLAVDIIFGLKLASAIKHKAEKSARAKETLQGKKDKASHSTEEYVTIAQDAIKQDIFKSVVADVASGVDEDDENDGNQPFVIHDSVSANEAHEEISDAVAMKMVISGSVSMTPGKKYAVNVDTLSASFKQGDIIDIDALKKAGIVPKGEKAIKILARGVLNKSLTVIADSFSADAIKMIVLVGGIAKLK